MRALLGIMLLCWLLPAQAAALRERLPPDTVGYLRIPSLWGIIDAGRQGVLGKALESPHHQEQVAKLQQALEQNVLKPAEIYTGPLPALLLHHLRSPLEAVSVLPEGLPVAMANVFITAKLNLASRDEFAALLKKIAGQDAPIRLMGEVAADGSATLAMDKSPIFVHYDAATHTLSMLGGVMANPDTFHKIRQRLAAAPEATPPGQAMQALEARIDSSGQGLFIWVNAKRLRDTALSGIDPATLQDLQEYGLLEAESAAAGYGIRDGKGRLSAWIDLPQKLFPPLASQWNLGVAGKPGIVAALNLPLQGLLKIGEEWLQKKGDPADQQEYAKFKQEFQKEIGISMEQFVQLFSGEMVFFSDEIGEFFALRVKDPAQASQLLNQIAAKHGVAADSRTIAGKNYHHLPLPGMLDQDMPTAENQEEQFFMGLVKRIRSHVFWTEEDGYLVFSTPPGLLDRQRLAQRVNLQEWLQANQRQNPAASVLFFSMRAEDTPRMLYYVYLYLLQALGDVAQEKFDWFGFPTPRDMNLPTHGTYGLQLDVGSPLVGLELTFEQNPLEFVLGYNMSGVAVAGILAAVAIPAHADYNKRAQVAEGVALLSGLKTAATEFFMQQGRLPQVEEIGGISAGTHVSRIYLLPEQNGYAAEFNEIPGSLVLLYDSKAQTWSCQAQDVPANYLPQSCR